MMLVAGIMLMAGMAAIWWVLAGPRASTAHQTANASLHPISPPVATAVVHAAPGTAGPLAKALDADPALERDAIFLLAAAHTHRCNAADGTALAHLATRAHLPVLKASTVLLNTAPAIAHALYDGVRDAARAIPCGADQVVWQVGTHALAVSLQAYTTGFPETYFHPEVTQSQGPSLLAHADSPCVEVAFATFPAAPDDSWQCAAARHAARSHVITDLCPASLADDGAQQRLALAVHQLKSNLPGVCQ
ncbi:hypothetical protein [Pinirhizobacter sp.]|uniref:hypothetical protein n=1 Tax=Pinirhizobacter sp. TaxID=2950432 RepID=UPI002F3F7C95